MLLLFAGCLHPVAQYTDHLHQDLAYVPIDTAMPLPISRNVATLLPPLNSTLVPASHQEPPQKGAKRLSVPPELPGAGAARVILPPTTAPPKEREAAIDKLYPPLAPLPADPELLPGPDGHALTLSDLQRLALNHSPQIRQPIADLEAAKGAAIQAGAYPNPVIGWAQDEVGTSNNGPSELGFFIGQTFVLGGKLTLARAIARVDVLNAELAVKRAQADLAGQVRSGYFAVLVARKNVEVSSALARFTDEIYRVQVEQVRLGQAAPYEPRQLRVFALQARNNLTAARNRHASAWSQLVATLGLATMPPTQLAGAVDMPVPVYRYDTALARVLQNHTDVYTARNVDQKARLTLQRARVQAIPDVTLNMHMNKFFTENTYVHSLDIQFPIPLYDRNRGGIIQAQGGLVRAVEEPRRVQADLTTRLAEAFERYTTNRQILEEFRDHILGDQVEAYLGAFERHQQEPDKVGFGDVVSAQQALAGTITSYVSTLGNLWQAVADVSTLLQTSDLFEGHASEQWPRVPQIDTRTR